MPKILKTLKKPDWRVVKDHSSPEGTYYYRADPPLSKVHAENLAPFGDWLSLFNAAFGKMIHEVATYKLFKEDSKERCWIRIYENGVYVIEYADATNLEDQKHQLRVYGYTRRLKLRDLLKEIKGERAEAYLLSLTWKER